MNKRSIAELRAITGSKPRSPTPRKSARPATRSPKPIDSTPGTLSADQGPVETRIRAVGRRRSNSRPKPKVAASGATLSGDQHRSETHATIVANGLAIPLAKPKPSAPAPSIPVGQVQCEIQNSTADSGEESRHLPEPKPLATPSPLIQTIVELWKQRQAWHRAEKSLTLQSSAICRRYAGGEKTDGAKLLKRIEKGAVDEDAYMACFPLLTARDSIASNRSAIEKALKKYAKQLPIAGWFEAVPNVSLMSLAALVGEMGDIGSYKSVSATWKRMGAAVIDGERQRRVSGIDALKHGYSPARRSVLWNVGSSLVGGMGKGPRPRVGEDTDASDDLTKYQKLFIREMRKWSAREPEAHRREPAERGGETYESFSLHAANHARRVVSKEFLKDVFLEWRRHTSCETQTKVAPPPFVSSECPS